MAEENDSQTPTDGPTRLPASNGSPLVLSSGHVFTAKKPCPYCGGKITCTVSAWEEEDDESWIATDLDIECDSEPPIDSRRWKEWEREHGGGDWGEAWHDMKEALLRDMKRRFRFDMEIDQNAKPTTPWTVPGLP